VKGFPPEFCLNILQSSIKLDALFSVFAQILKHKKKSILRINGARKEIFCVIRYVELPSVSYRLTGACSKREIFSFFKSTAMIFKIKYQHLCSED